MPKGLCHRGPLPKRDEVHTHTHTHTQQHTINQPCPILLPIDPEIYPNIDETITPLPILAGSPIAVPDRENVASIPPTEEILTTPQHMDHPFEYLIDAAFAAQFQPTKDTIFPLISYQ